MSGATKGDLSLLILATLAEQPGHGYEVARRIERRSSKALQAREGALYPALRLLEADGLITGTWEIQPSGPARRIYTVTPAGRTALAARVQAWQAYVRAVQAILGGQPEAQNAASSVNAIRGGRSDVEDA